MGISRCYTNKQKSYTGPKKKARHSYTSPPSFKPNKNQKRCEYLTENACPHIWRLSNSSTARSTLSPSPASVTLNASRAWSAVNPISTMRWIAFPAVFSYAGVSKISTCAGCWWNTGCAICAGELRVLSLEPRELRLASISLVAACGRWLRKAGWSG